MSDLMLASFAGAWVTWMGTYLIHSTIVLGGAALASGRLVRSVAGRDLLWKSALLAPLATATLQVSFGYTPFAGEWSLAAGAAWTGSWLALPTAGAGGPAPVDAAGVAGGNYAVALVLAWFGAAVLGVLATARSYRRFRLFMDRRPVRDPELLAMLAVLQEELGPSRPVWLSSSTRCSSPVALGRSEVCLPECFLRGMGPLEVRSVLAHELAHLVRGDPAWQTAALILSRVMFFQPLNGFARRRMMEVAEYACDDDAVRRTGTALGMLRALAAIAEARLDRASPAVVGATAMAARGSVLVTRSERLAKGRCEAPHRPSAGDLLLVAGLVAAVALGAPACSGISASSRAVVANVHPSEHGGRVEPRASKELRVLHRDQAAEIARLVRSRKSEPARPVFVSLRNGTGFTTTELSAEQARQVVELLKEARPSGALPAEELEARLRAILPPPIKASDSR